MREFYQALFHKRDGHVVLGRQLRPFSLWHLALLNFAQSPFIGHSGPISLAELVKACAICATRYPEPLRLSHGWRERWHHARACATAVRDLRPEMHRFLVYKADYCAGVPEFFHSAGSKSCKCPTPLALWSALVLRSNLSRAEAWDTPPALAAWEKTGLAEAEGNEIDLVNDAAKAAMVKAGWGHLLERSAS